MLSWWMVFISLVFGISCSGFLKTCTRANNSHMEKIKYLITKLFKLLKFIKHFLIEIYKTLLDVTGRYEFPS